MLDGLLQWDVEDEDGNGNEIWAANSRVWLDDGFRYVIGPALIDNAVQFDASFSDSELLPVDESAWAEFGLDGPLFPSIEDAKAACQLLENAWAKEVLAEAARGNE